MLHVHGHDLSVEQYEKYGENNLLVQLRFWFHVLTDPLELQDLENPTSTL